MSQYIDFNLPKYVREAAKRAATRYKSINLGDYWERLIRIDPEDIWQKLVDYPEIHWSGAVPVSEPTGYHQGASAQPSPIMAVDGSQISSDPDMVFLWAYVQAVAVGMRRESVYRSDFADIDSMLAGEVIREDLQKILYSNLSSLTTFVDLWRTMIELDVCLEAGEKFPDHLILWDNPLLPIGAGVRSGLLREIYSERFVKMEKRSIVGVISGPKSHLLSNLIILSENQGMPEALKIRSQINDTVLIRYGLPIGHRSAVFRFGSPFENKIDQNFPNIYFFFCRVNEIEVVRIEIPEWIAVSPGLIDTVHASILKDSIALGYSLTLLTAHNTVALSLEMGRELNLRAWSEYTQFGGKFFWPAKIQAKGGKFE